MSHMNDEDLDKRVADEVMGEWYAGWNPSGNFGQAMKVVAKVMSMGDISFSLVLGGTPLSNKWEWVARFTDKSTGESSYLVSISMLEALCQAALSMTLEIKRRNKQKLTPELLDQWEKEALEVGEYLAPCAKSYQLDGALERHEAWLSDIRGMRKAMFPKSRPEPAVVEDCGSCGHVRLRTETARQTDPCRCPCHQGSSRADVEKFWKGGF